jgi:hypothetical protein
MPPPPFRKEKQRDLGRAQPYHARIGHRAGRTAVLERGVWTAHVYVPVPDDVAAKMRAAMSAATGPASAAPSSAAAAAAETPARDDANEHADSSGQAGAPAMQADLHLSLSVPIELREWQMAPFVKALQRSLVGEGRGAPPPFAPFTIEVPLTDPITLGGADAGRGPKNDQIVEAKPREGANVLCDAFFFVFFFFCFFFFFFFFSNFFLFLLPSSRPHLAVPCVASV